MSSIVLRPRKNTDRPSMIQSVRRKTVPVRPFASQTKRSKIRDFFPLFVICETSLTGQIVLISFGRSAIRWHFSAVSKAQGSSADATTEEAPEGRTARPHQNK
ncbi:hypothetical protein GWI33_009950 [Rhynchophorus ferrugineus]|uniref:Uncharacterized protein n=1 Tax=Rhynchophorus ferrugineus TaxID=354439 RepID=A0A834MME9_RHYFE|nr:hypothetical protein GWI33_009950 [Rhynchophorus ferrugineus]